METKTATSVIQTTSDQAKMLRQLRAQTMGGYLNTHVGIYEQLRQCFVDQSEPCCVVDKRSHQSKIGPASEKGSRFYDGWLTKVTRLLTTDEKFRSTM